MGKGVFKIIVFFLWIHTFLFDKLFKKKEKYMKLTY